MPLVLQLRSKLPLPFLVLLLIACFCILVRVNSFSSSRYSKTPNSVSPTAMRSSSTPSSAKSLSFEWKSLDPSSFTSPVSQDDGYRYAKDQDYLRAVLDSWKEDTVSALSSEQGGVETSSWTYHDVNGTPLYGHIVRPIVGDAPQSPNRPGILLFHTAAGPQDVFLFQKAAKLASSDLGCVVLICDVLSDQDGWAWTPDGDRTRFNNAKEELLEENGALLRSRVEAAIRTLISNDLGVDPTRIAGLGWCFGAQPILELAALQHSQETKKEGGDFAFSATALVSYHGVYRRGEFNPSDISTSDSASSGETLDREVLICTGKSDPFVATNDLEFAKVTMGGQNFAVRIMEFDGAKHGFTNPAQDFNSSPAFAYNENAATQSWEATMELLKRKLL